MKYDSFQIITNGEKFRIQVTMEYPGGCRLCHLSKDNCWCGSNSMGYVPAGPKLEFNSRQEAVDYIQKEFGQVGYRKLLENWNPC